MSCGGCPVPHPQTSCRPEAPQLATCLNEQLFTYLTDARFIIETWRRRHAELRLHSALRYAAPYRIRPTDSGPPVAYGSLRPQPVAEVSTLWYRLVSNPAPGLISASRSVLPH